MKAKLINEHIDWKGNWIPDKKDPFEKTAIYYRKKELKEELLKIISKYKKYLKDIDIAEVLQEIHNKNFSN